jgi:hypothetical protein
MNEVYIVDVGCNYERSVIGVASTRDSAIEIARMHTAKYGPLISHEYYEMRRAPLDCHSYATIDDTSEVIDVD